MEKRVWGFFLKPRTPPEKNGWQVIDASSKNGLSSKGCVGEVHNSVYDLTVRDIKLEGGGDNAFNLSIIDLTNPVIGSDTIIDVFLGSVAISHPAMIIL